MARMQLLVAVAGEDDWYPGQVVDVDEATAAVWCDGVRARRVEAPAPMPPASPRRTGKKAVANPGGEIR